MALTPGGQIYRPIPRRKAPYYKRRLGKWFSETQVPYLSCCPSSPLHWGAELSTQEGLSSIQSRKLEVIFRGKGAKLQGMAHSVLGCWRVGMWLRSDSALRELHVHCDFSQLPVWQSASCLYPSPLLGWGSAESCAVDQLRQLLEISKISSLHVPETQIREIWALS